MTSYRLELSVPSPLPGDANHVFYWPSDGHGSFLSPGLDVDLHRLGPINEANVEFTRLAVAVFAADRTMPREFRGTNWSSRNLDVTVPMYDPDRWTSLRERLEALLRFLTGDRWSLHFVKDQTRRLAPLSVDRGVSKVVLLSGGADSAVGALLTRHADPGAVYALVSHVSATSISPIQRSVAGDIQRLVPGPEFRHHQLRFSRRQRQVNRQTFQNEYSSRSRSLLFLSFGLAVASVDNVPLVVPENGFASLNPALSPDQRGSLSTKTTHPAYLEGLQSVLRDLGAHADLYNPFAGMTKGEMFRQAADIVGEDEASQLLSASYSCAHTGQRSHHAAVSMQCGVCFGCLVRRAAFRASGLADNSRYLLGSTDPNILKDLADWSVEASVRSFVDHDIDSAVIAGLSLPASVRPKDAADLCSRAAAELGAIV